MRTVKLGYLVRFRNGQDSKQVESIDGEYPIIGSGGEFSRATSYLYDGESILFGRKGTIDRPLHIEGKFWTVDTMYFTEIRPEAFGRYLYYWAKTIPFHKISTQTALPSMTSFTLSQLKVPLPDLPTQRRIADYLDRETVQIDAMAEALDGLVARLEERRSAVITHYVTGGHTQRRAATIPETQGSTFPATAEYLPTAQLRHYAEVNPPTTEFTLISPGDPVTFMSLDTVWPDGHADVGAEVTWTGQSHSYTPFRRGDVLLPKVSPTFSMGRATVAHTPHPVGLASSEVFVLRPRENADARFIAYAVRSTDFLAEGTASQQGVGGLRRVSSGWVGSYNFPQYDLVEQRRIADHLDAETAKIDAMIAKAGELRALLDERRSALITATVTGQHPVPEEP